MKKKESVYGSLREALTDIFGSELSIRSSQDIFGGDINDSFVITMSDGQSAFVKANSNLDPSFFGVEAHGLKAIDSTGTVQTPKVLGRGIDEGDFNGQKFSFLLLKYLASPGFRRKDAWENFARQLVEMHEADTFAFIPDDQPGQFGFYENNYIGRTDQLNAPKSTWIEFFRDCRLEPLYKKTYRLFSDSDRNRMDYLLDHLDRYLVEPRHPSLVHGDMWSGNIMTGPDGAIWLIDPAVYIGNAEVDLAMSELFGGYPPEFYAAYKEIADLIPGYEERRDLYNLYHLLNHLHLFGWGYYGEVVAVLKEYV